MMMMMMMMMCAGLACCLGAVGRACVHVRVRVCACMSCLLLQYCCVRACLHPCPRLNFICTECNANCILQLRPLVLHSSASRSARTALACCLHGGRGHLPAAALTSSFNNLLLFPLTTPELLGLPE